MSLLGVEKRDEVRGDFAGQRLPAETKHRQALFLLPGLGCDRSILLHRIVLPAGLFGQPGEAEVDDKVVLVQFQCLPIRFQRGFEMRLGGGTQSGVSGSRYVAERNGWRLHAVIGLRHRQRV